MPTYKVLTPEDAPGMVFGQKCEGWNIANVHTGDIHGPFDLEFVFYTNGKWWLRYPGCSTASPYDHCRIEIQEPKRPAKCKDCGKLYSEFPIDTTVPDDQWDIIYPNSNGGGILCANCMVERAAKIDGIIAARMAFEFKRTPHYSPKLRTGQPIEVWRKIGSECLRRFAELVNDGVTTLPDEPGDGNSWWPNYRILENYDYSKPAKG